MTAAPPASSAPPPSAVLFDFDGTLADTFPRVERLLPRLARELGFLDPGEEGVRALRGRNMRSILSHLGIPWWKVPLVLWRARALLEADPEIIPLFPGIVELLTDLDKAGIEWGILTSNGIDVVRRTLYQNGAPEPGWLEAGLGLSGKSKRIRRMAGRWGIPAGDLVLIGDETRDVDAARKAQVPMVAVTWGYNTADALREAGATRLAQDVGELRRILLGKADESEAGKEGGVVDEQR
ncbi:MAG TPA: HAD hydrolase-like protein [Fibrobacteria bacterium]|nr:HAD hydrolase-like protein [Fibrobacteria bacterium]